MTFSGTMVTFTINNWTEDHVARLNKLAAAKQTVILKAQTEVGEEKTPHIQGIIKVKKTIMDWHKHIPGAHFERVRNMGACMNYCNKEDTHDGKHRWCVVNMLGAASKKRTAEAAFEEMQEEAWARKRARYTDVEWKAWQQKVIDVIEGEVDERTIHWFWEATGNVGKSFLSTYLMACKDAVIVNGMGGDFAHMLKNQMLRLGKMPEIIVIDIPRKQAANISYSKLEEISNGVVTSTKYESDVIALDPVHKIVFANFPPTYEDMSIDRFKVTLVT